MLLNGKVVIVTGVGPGMGRKLCLEAAAAGASVVLAARSKAFIDGVEAELTGKGFEAIAVPADVSKVGDCQRLADAAVERFGRIDGLVNSAFGRGQFVPFEEADLDDWRGAMEVTLFGSLQMVRAVLPQMKEQGKGSIVNVSTMETRKPLPEHGSYTVAKAALLAATRQLAVELGKYGIRVNSAIPGWMWGGPVEGYMTEAVKQHGGSLDAMKATIARNIPLGHIPPDEECAKAVLTLLSDFTSQVTGASLEINGGEYVSL
jgi:NAD(P)-dependent dehydrogenase (short-subunit alcohol dehydrogenase family)